MRRNAQNYRSYKWSETLAPLVMTSGGCVSILSSQPPAVTPSNVAGWVCRHLWACPGSAQTGSLRPARRDHAPLFRAWPIWRWGNRENLLLNQIFCVWVKWMHTNAYVSQQINLYEYLRNFLHSVLNIYDHTTVTLCGPINWNLQLWWELPESVNSFWC